MRPMERIISRSPDDRAYKYSKGKETRSDAQHLERMKMSVRIVPILVAGLVLPLVGRERGRNDGVKEMQHLENMGGATRVSKLIRTLILMELENETRPE